MTPGKCCSSSRSSSKVMSPLQSLSADSKSARVSWSSFSSDSEMALSSRQDCSTVRSSSASMEPLPVPGGDDAKWGACARTPLCTCRHLCPAQSLHRVVNFSCSPTSVFLQPISFRGTDQTVKGHVSPWLTNPPWLPIAKLNRDKPLPEHGEALASAPAWLKNLQPPR